MKRRIIFTLVAMAMVVALTGCDQIVNRILYGTPQKPEVKKPVIEKIKTPELAKKILRPVKHQLDVTKDPFRPLIEAKSTVAEDKEAYTPADVEFIGVVRVADEYQVLLKTNAKKGLFRVHDRIKNFTIEDIQHDRVVLNNGIKSITLKRGE